MSTGNITVCIVGAGPRGVSVLERLCANERKSAAHPAVVVHLVDPFPPGSGQVWRITQSPLLLMNTVACQVTVYTDDSVDMDGPVEAGPSLYEWASALVAAPDKVHVSGTATSSRKDSGTESALLAEARRIGPDTYPSRAFYGSYLRDAFRRVVAQAPAHVRVLIHQARAVKLEEAGREGTQTVTLSNGTRLVGMDAVVLCLGHLPAKATPEEERIAREAAAVGLTHLPPANPADVDLSHIPAGEPVLLRGLGLNFFDYLPLFTIARGGRYERIDGGGMVYHPSGNEPKLHAGSRRGVPYHARGENEKGAHGRYEPRLLTVAKVARLQQQALERQPLTFGDDVWPLVAREVECVYYEAWLGAAGRGAERAAFAERYLAGGGERRLLDAHGIPPADRWDWERISRPYGRRVFADRSEFRAWLLGHLARDVREAHAGNVSGPLKAALDVLRDLRNEIRLVVDHGGLEGNSYRDELQGWYTPLNAFLSIGPPASRIEELIALVNAGVVDFVGPGTTVRIERDATGRPCFAAVSDRVGGPPVRARALIEARLPEPDVRRTGDALLSHLVATGQARPYRIDGAYGTSYETGGLAVSKRPYRLLTADGHVHRRRFAYGVPTEAVHWVTAAGIRPGVNSVTLGDSDAIACAVLELTPARTTAGHRQPARPSRQLTEPPS
ncbi:FAD/NAD(P)-binding protein [Actinacidiphila oryziradicis]|uniref:FAD/NAD(P)-binding protein n=1 Tax=Actinacidiphila oryziradicis TaxID=2571141 RepID=A0A4U0RXF1_9ACTN|nr:FAD/NAD(P)-binding protein [Actinacidiphila oryziradicis]TKA00313.1 FAD/NAD(P)-binding protein [Actinacidiphila oryziradicis]